MWTSPITVLFPSRAREFPGQRWVNICLRCAHLVGVAGVAGGFLYDLAHGQWSVYWYLTLVSGIALSLVYLWSGAIWLFELKGLAIIVKVLLLLLGSLVPDTRAAIFILVIILSGLVAHAPGRVRSWRWLRAPEPQRT